MMTSPCLPCAAAHSRTRLPSTFLTFSSRSTTSGSMPVVFSSVTVSTSVFASTRFHADSSDSTLAEGGLPSGVVGGASSFLVGGASSWSSDGPVFLQALLLMKSVLYSDPFSHGGVLKISTCWCPASST